MAYRKKFRGGRGARRRGKFVRGRRGRSKRMSSYGVSRGGIRL